MSRSVKTVWKQALHREESLTSLQIYKAHRMDKLEITVGTNLLANKRSASKVTGYRMKLELLNESSSRNEIINSVNKD